MTGFLWWHLFQKTKTPDFKSFGSCFGECFQHAGHNCDKAADLLYSITLAIKRLKPKI